MKGNALIGQSGGPTSVINGSLYGAAAACIGSDRIDRTLGMRFGIEGFLSGEVVDLGAESSSQLELLKYTPSSALGSCRYKLQDEDLPRVLDALRRYDIRYYFMIGGNDTMDTIHRIEEYCRDNGYDLNGIGIPKTVDNDLFGTDHTPGFPSAARYVALSVKQSALLARDMQRVDKFVVHQTVGRDAGWLAASATAARSNHGDAPHVVLLPERRISPSALLSQVESAVNAAGFAYIVVGEGALWEDGTPISAASATDEFSNVEFGAMGGTSAALNLHGLITRETGYRGEFQIPESLPMCADDRVTDVDREEAVGCGEKAVSLALDGCSGVMVTINRLTDVPYHVEYCTIALDEVARQTRPLPEEYIQPSGYDLTEAFGAYLSPLIGPMPEYSALAHQPAL
jgi:ATP-dependent phosphofructokinase / diphosphate-dependent phosphofructokinase